MDFHERILQLCLGGLNCVSIVFPDYAFYRFRSFSGLSSSVCRRASSSPRLSAICTVEIIRGYPEVVGYRQKQTPGVCRFYVSIGIYREFNLTQKLVMTLFLCIFAV